MVNYPDTLVFHTTRDSENDRKGTGTAGKGILPKLCRKREGVEGDGNRPRRRRGLVRGKGIQGVAHDQLSGRNLKLQIRVEHEGDPLRRNSPQRNGIPDNHNTQRNPRNRQCEGRKRRCTALVRPRTTRHGGKDHRPRVCTEHQAMKMSNQTRHSNENYYPRIFAIK